MNYPKLRTSRERIDLVQIARVCHCQDHLQCDKIALTQRVAGQRGPPKQRRRHPQPRHFLQPPHYSRAPVGPARLNLQLPCGLLLSQPVSPLLTAQLPASDSYPPFIRLSSISRAGSKGSEYCDSHCCDFLEGVRDPSGVLSASGM